MGFHKVWGKGFSIKSTLMKTKDSSLKKVILISLFPIAWLFLVLFAFHLTAMVKF